MTQNRIQGQIRRIPVLLVLLACLLYLPVSAFAAPDGGVSDWNDRYAVAIYGIRHDQYRSGDETGTAGLTFGPATGAIYLERYRAHVTLKEYREDPDANRCIHWMTWEEIAEQSLKDPTVFHDCLVHGCTHSVDLLLNEKLLKKDYSRKLTGDGASALLDGPVREALLWNGIPSNSGGWPACRARAILNGADEYAAPALVGEAFLLQEDESLLSCFPETLREIIVPKAVQSDLGTPGIGSQPVITYDKLWLFSTSELYGVGIFPEGEPYERNVLIRNREAGFGGGYVMYSEVGNEAWAWFRSISADQEVLERHIFGGGGHMTASGFYRYYALTPGFCLP